jgi:hypothetical protein
MGLRSGEYFGSRISLAPTARMARRTAFFVAAEIVHDHDIAGLKRWDQHPLDIDPEALAIDRTVDQPRRFDPIAAQGGQEGHGLPMAVRHLGFEPQAPSRPAPQRRHVGLGPGLIEEDQAAGVDPALILNPLRSPSRDVRTILFASHQCFF